jgi:hypothetical protein
MGQSPQMRIDFGMTEAVPFRFPLSRKSGHPEEQ